MQDMWEKWVFLATLAASTSLMRTSVGNILASPGGKDFLLGMLDECSAIAGAEGFVPGGPFFQRTRGLLTTEGSPMTASMFRDIKAGLPVEADHVIGDLVARADAAKMPVPKLRIAYTHLKAYENSGGETLMMRRGGVTLVLSSARTDVTPPRLAFRALQKRPPPGEGQARASQMRQIMRERFDLFFAQGIGDIGHRGPAAAGSHA